MLKFDQNEIDYVEKEFKKLIEDINNFDSIEDEDYRYYLNSIEDNNMLKVIENVDKINSDIEINKVFVNELLYTLGMFCFLDNQDSVEQVMEYLKDVDEEYFTIYEKLLKHRLEG